MNLKNEIRPLNGSWNCFRLPKTLNAAWLLSIMEPMRCISVLRNLVRAQLPETL